MAGTLEAMDTTQTTPASAGPGAGFTSDHNVSRSRSLSGFRRSREHRVLGGVCGGLAEALNLDVALVRVLAIVLAVVTNGIGALAYLAAWLVVPEEGSETTALSAVLRR